jgi:DNA-binding beta-propeller fold protein YncE
MGEGPGSFKYPYGVEVMEDGTAMVAEFGNNRLQRIDLETGESRGVFGVPGRAKGQLSTPWAVTWIGGEAYVLDSGNNRIQVFEKPD